MGGKTALGLLGKSHYLEFSPQNCVLFGGEKEKIPAWFQQYKWPMKLHYYSTAFLPPELGMTDHEVNGFSIKISSAARAMMECLYLAPEKQELKECYELMEGLNNLRPNLVQELLTTCSSIKVKRLFLYMATKAGHPWLPFIDQEKISLGTGKRQLAQNGVYVPEFMITIPKDLFNDEL
ncbi:hypothetical protein GCM10011339_11420 [Echinicola rosea]|uniref:Transcriptional regulator AbiEi antitoxin N-terminal domain-containing protein n=2 Tax=Echinicola rosea TaxID=1807691 RepID=A0ABQ1UQW2_9BACT|nr:hypothetical protein GCM10011339_11420 [Echinicola rosea]